MLTWKVIGERRYQISRCYFWPKYDIELLEPLPEGYEIVGHLKHDSEFSEDKGIIDHVDAESPEGFTCWLPCRVLKLWT